MTSRTRARSLTVVAILAAGAVALIGSTQTWAVAALPDGPLPAPGSIAVPVLQPLALTVLALGLVLTLVGRALRYALGVLAIAAAAAIGALTVPMLVDPPVSAVAPVVTERTGLAGLEAIAGVVRDVTATPWPAVTLACAIVVAVAGAVVLVTAHRWTQGGRRYSAAEQAPRSATGPLDSVHSWDDLSRGDDPTR